MRVLIADDDRVLRRALQVQLEQWGYDPIVCADGEEARGHLLGGTPPSIAVLDRSMPGLDGLTLCELVRANPKVHGLYIILLTSYDTRADIVAGLHSGADEYIVKPFDAEMLRMRLAIASRIVSLQDGLRQRVAELQEALAQVKTLSGLVPICSYCKRIRDDKDYWQQLEGYIADRTHAQFSHGVCPDCYARALREFDAEAPA